MISKAKAAFSVIKKIRNFWDYFIDFFGFSGRESIIYDFRDGTRFKVRSSKVAGIYDRRVFNEIFIHEYYTPKGFEIRKGDTVLDIGGHIGAFTVFASKLADKVYVFEPVPFNFELLKENLELNGLKNVVVAQKALSNKKGMSKIFLSGSNLATHSFYKSWAADQTESIDVSTTTLEDFVFENEIKKIDFLKMDVEGAEYEILPLINGKLLDKIKKMVIETHDIDKDSNIETVKKLMTEKGFSVNSTYDGISCGMVYAKKE